MIFFFDENISESVAYMLGHADRQNEMRAMVDYFDKGTPDTAWMQIVAEWEGDVAVVTHDRGILRNHAEKQVLKECALTFVFLAPAWAKLPWPTFAWRIVKVWPDITRNVKEARFPTVFRVSGGLKVQSEVRVDRL